MEIDTYWMKFETSFANMAYISKHRLKVVLVLVLLFLGRLIAKV